MSGRVLFSPLAASGNLEAVKEAAGIARTLGAALTLVGVVPPPTRLQSSLQPWNTLKEAVDRAVASVESDLDRLMSAVEDVPTNRIVEVADAANTLVDLARSAELLVVTADETTGCDPVVRRVLHHCPCPVWVVKPHTGQPGNVLAAVIPDPDEHEVNRSILEYALQMQSLSGGSLDVVAAWRRYGEDTPASDPQSAEASDRAFEADYREVVERLVRPIAPEAEVHLEHGRADQVVAALVDRRGIDHLVMGSSVRRGLAFGNTAERLLDTLSCSVVAIKAPWTAQQLRTEPDPGTVES